MGFGDVHMEDNLGIKRAMGWDDDNPMIGKGMNLPRVLRQDVNKIKCNLTLL